MGQEDKHPDSSFIPRSGTSIQCRLLFFKKARFLGFLYEGTKGKRVITPILFAWQRTDWLFSDMV